MLRHRHETIIEAQRRQARYSLGSPGRRLSSPTMDETPRPLLSSAVGAFSLLACGGIAMLDFSDIDGGRWRTATIISLDDSGCEVSWAGPPAGSGHASQSVCSGDEAAGQQVRVFVDEYGEPFADPGEATAMAWLAAAIGLVTALACAGAAWRLWRDPDLPTKSIRTGLSSHHVAPH